jgi:hypothetical protein
LVQAAPGKRALVAKGAGTVGTAGATEEQKAAVVVAAMAAMVEHKEARVAGAVEAAVAVPEVALAAVALLEGSAAGLEEAARELGPPRARY